MKLDILPADLKTVKITKGASTISIPTDLMKRHGLKGGDKIVIAYICKAEDNISIG